MDSRNSQCTQAEGRVRAVRRGTGTRSAPLAAAKGRGQPELHWTRAEKPRGQFDGIMYPVPR
jgi:hypothetical protein